MTAAKQNTDENKTVMCLGAPLLPNIIDEVKKMPRPQIGDIRWTDPRNWFVSFQSFFKVRPDLDLNQLKSVVKKNIFFKYFPLLLQPRELILYPSNTKPRQLEWKLDIVSIKDPRANIKEMIGEMQEDMREVLKETSYSYQSIECDPSLIMARIPEAMHADEVHMKKILALLGEKPYREKFYLEKAYIVCVNKDEFGLQYDYTEIKEG